jgi:hypothetical protein
VCWTGRLIYCPRFIDFSEIWRRRETARVIPIKKGIRIRSCPRTTVTLVSHWSPITALGNLINREYIYAYHQRAYISRENCQAIQHCAKYAVLQRIYKVHFTLQWLVISVLREAAWKTSFLSLFFPPLQHIMQIIFSGELATFSEQDQKWILSDFVVHAPQN